MAWIAYWDEVCGIEAAAKTRGLRHVAERVGWWWAFQNMAILTDRPVALHRDADNRLHHEAEMAIRYSDGFGVWCWHGVRVPQFVIEQPETITAQAILKEQNAEVRRVMLERMGVGAFVRDASPTVLHEDVDGAGQRRRLLSVSVPWVAGPMVVCHVVCPSTGHEHLLSVPPETKRCDEAVAWTFGLASKQYAPSVEA